MCVCVCVHACISLFPLSLSLDMLCSNLCVYVWVCACMHASLSSLCVWVWTCLCSNLCVCVCVHVRASACVCVCVCMHACISLSPLCLSLDVLTPWFCYEHEQIGDWTMFTFCTQQPGVTLKRPTCVATCSQCKTTLTGLWAWVPPLPPAPDLPVTTPMAQLKVLCLTNRDLWIRILNYFRYDHQWHDRRCKKSYHMRYSAQPICFSYRSM